MKAKTCDWLFFGVVGFLWIALFVVFLTQVVKFIQ